MNTILTASLLTLSVAVILLGLAFTSIKHDQAKILRWLLELNQDAGDIKRRQTWSKKRERKQLKK